MKSISAQLNPKKQMVHNYRNIHIFWISTNLSPPEKLIEYIWNIEYLFNDVLAVGLGDSISNTSPYNNNDAQFSTFDNDNDASSTTNNAAKWRGAWWYHNGHTSNLNGEYGNINHGEGINWYNFKGYTRSLSGARMMLRMPWLSLVLYWIIF